MGTEEFKQQLIRQHLGGRVLGLTAHTIFDGLCVQFLAVGEAGCSGLMHLLASNRPAMAFCPQPESIGGSLRKVVSLNEEQLLRPGDFRADMVDAQADFLFILCDLSDPFCQLALPGLARIIQGSEALNIVCAVQHKQGDRAAEDRLLDQLVQRHLTVIQVPEGAEGANARDLIPYWHGVFSRMVSACLDVVIYPGLVGMDYADVRCVLTDAGRVILGHGLADGEGRGRLAVFRALADTRLDASDYAQVTRIQICVSADASFRIKELHEILKAVREKLPVEHLNMIINNVLDDRLGTAMDVKLLLSRSGWT